uniref:Uncharacterized protein n=1 Tax=Rhizophora mucronata TaxID=61149 RepID=A0A2P2P0V4_RHIMU
MGKRNLIDLLQDIQSTQISELSVTCSNQKNILIP